jgi:hypothetical protein
MKVLVDLFDEEQVKEKKDIQILLLSLLACKNLS